MLLNIPEMPQHLILALDHHQQLIEDARRQRETAAARRISEADRLPRWRRWRGRVGDLLVNTWQWLAAKGARKSRSPKTVWG